MFSDQGPRRVVPRWRPSAVASRTPEVASTKMAPTINLDGEIRDAESQFRREPSVPIAAELMFVAQQANDIGLAKTAAKEILGYEANIASTSLVRVAREIINDSPAELSLPLANEFVRSARKILNQEFNNPILLVDVARALTSNGQPSAARRYIRAALALAPKSRFVLRSAVRYFLHVEEKEYAHQLLIHSELLKGDSWIQASEIAVATVLGRTSKHVKALDRVLSADAVLGFDQSELGSAIATVHMNAGSDKRAKKLFAKTLMHPNDNSVAQAEWASRPLGLAVSEHALKLPFTYEANSNHSYRTLNIDDAIVQAKRWLDDEPFAARPASWLGYLHALNDDFVQSAEFHQLAIRVQPQPSTSELLNLNFSRIENGAVDEAAVQLAELTKSGEAKLNAAQILANIGALFYATGDVERGREFYQRALTAARSARDISSEGMAYAFFARAAMKYRDPSVDAIIAGATKFTAQALNPGATYVMSRLVDEVTRKKLEASAIKKVARQKLNWDPVTNVLRLE